METGSWLSATCTASRHLTRRVAAVEGRREVANESRENSPSDPVPGHDRLAETERDQGGEAACWLAWTCPDCGAFVGADPPVNCPRCGNTLW